MADTFSKSTIAEICNGIAARPTAKCYLGFASGEQMFCRVCSSDPASVRVNAADSAVRCCAVKVSGTDRGRSSRRVDAAVAPALLRIAVNCAFPLAAHDGCLSSMDETIFASVYLGDPRLAAHAASATPVWLWSADGSRLLWANPAACAALGAAKPAGAAGAPVRHRRSCPRPYRAACRKPAARGAAPGCFACAALPAPAWTFADLLLCAPRIRPHARGSS